MASISPPPSLAADAQVAHLVSSLVKQVVHASLFDPEACEAGAGDATTARWAALAKAGRKEERRGSERRGGEARAEAWAENEEAWEAPQENGGEEQTTNNDGDDGVPLTTTTPENLAAAEFYERAADAELRGLATRVPVAQLDASTANVEKRAMKRWLKALDTAFEATYGRRAVKAEKEALRPLYVRYARLKRRIGEADDDMVRSTVPTSTSSTVASPARARRHRSEKENAASGAEASPVLTRPTRLVKAHSDAPLQPKAGVLRTTSSTGSGGGGAAWR